MVGLDHRKRSSGDDITPGPAAPVDLCPMEDHVAPAGRKDGRHLPFEVILMANSANMFKSEGEPSPIDMKIEAGV